MKEKGITLKLLLRMLRHVKNNGGVTHWDSRYKQFRRSFMQYKTWLVDVELLKMEVEDHGKWTRNPLWITPKGEQLLEMFTEVT